MGLPLEVCYEVRDSPVSKLEGVHDTNKKTEYNDQTLPYIACNSGDLGISGQTPHSGQPEDDYALAAEMSSTTTRERRNQFSRVMKP